MFALEKKKETIDLETIFGSPGPLWFLHLGNNNVWKSFPKLEFLKKKSFLFKEEMFEMVHFK